MGYPEVETIMVMVRNPVERFRSACARRNKTFNEAFEIRDEDVHFWSLDSMGLIGLNLNYYLFPEQINLFRRQRSGVGQSSPVPRLNEEKESKKPNFTNEQIGILKDVYKNDIALYNRLKEKLPWMNLMAKF
jgi:hypothetical protein